MKLRNKKTGKVFDVIVREKSNGDGEYSIIVCNIRALRSARSVSSILGEYDSLAQLNEEWEDYKPKEPYIRNERIRRFVRDWAEAFGVTKVYVCGIGDGKEYIELYAQDNGVTDGRIRISIPTQDGVWIGKEYTITELCGEEK